MRTWPALLAVLAVCTVLAAMSLTCGPGHSCVEPVALPAGTSPTCDLGRWIRLGKCRAGLDNEGCAEAYVEWQEAGCLCATKSYPWAFLPKGTTAIGYVWTLMALNMTYEDIAGVATCLEQAEHCRAASEGDVRLDAYGTGVNSQIQVYDQDTWKTIVGSMAEADAQAVCGKLGFTNGALATDGPPVDGPTFAIAPCAEDLSRPGATLLDCTASDAPASDTALRIECGGMGPMGCFLGKDGVPVCVSDGQKVSPEEAMGDMPTLACGTAGTEFVQRQFSPEGEPLSTQAADCGPPGVLCVAARLLCAASLVAACFIGMWTLVRKEQTGDADAADYEGPSPSVPNPERDAMSEQPLTVESAPADAQLRAEEGTAEEQAGVVADKRSVSDAAEMSEEKEDAQDPPRARRRRSAVAGCGAGRCAVM